MMVQFNFVLCCIVFYFLKTAFFVKGCFFIYTERKGIEQMKRVAIIAVILEDPQASQEKFNKIVSDFRTIIKGRMGLPDLEHNISMIALAIQGTMDEINNFTGKIGALPKVSAKTVLSKIEID